ncbi:MAG: cation-translocating P-type ATPase [Thermoleophilia bacterium]
MSAPPGEHLVFEGDGPIGEAQFQELRRRALALPGVVDCVRAGGDRLISVHFDPVQTRRAIVRTGMERADLRLLGARGGVRALTRVLRPTALAGAARTVWDSEQRLAVLMLLVCLVGTVSGFVVQTVAGLVPALPAYVLAYVAGGARATRKTIGSLRERSLDVDLLMLLAAAGAAAVEAWWEGGVLLFLFSLGGVLEEFALGRTHRSVRALMDLRPDVVTIVDDGGERIVAVEDVVPGQLAAVRPGDRIPVDGEVESGQSAVDQSAITGESLPVSKAPGAQVYAGTINLSGYLRVRITRRAAESMLARVIDLVADAQAQKAPAQRALDRYQPLYVAGVLGVATAAFAAFLLMGRAPGTAFLQAMTLLVVASPCALVISVPASMLSALARAARDGILIKGSGPLEQMARLRVVAFDKTGTLTRGELRVDAVVPAAGVTPGEVLAAAAAVERLSRHPLAVALTAHATDQGVVTADCTEFLSVDGRGAEGVVAGRRVVVGSPAFMADHGVAVDQVDVRLAEGAAEVLVGESGGRLLGVIGVSDVIRPDAASALARLHGLGLRTALLSGDRAAVARRVAGEVGVDDVHAELMPDAKVARVRDLAADGSVAMVGDGVNDAPALAAATVGIAMGVRGSDQALETADTWC